MEDLIRALVAYADAHPDLKMSAYDLVEMMCVNMVDTEAHADLDDIADEHNVISWDDVLKAMDAPDDWNE